MLYIKHNGENIELYGDEFYGMCPICGKEIKVELENTIVEGRVDLDGSPVCDECEKHGYPERFVNAVNDGTWQQYGALMLIDDVKVRERIQEEGFRVFVCPVTGTLQLTNDDGLEFLIDLFIAINRRNGTL
jgi:hypothetical protein